MKTHLLVARCRLPTQVVQLHLQLLCFALQLLQDFLLFHFLPGLILVNILEHLYGKCVRYWLPLRRLLQNLYASFRVFFTFLLLRF